MNVEEGDGFLPRILRLRFAVAFRVGVILEAVAGSVVAMEFVGDTRVLEGLLVVVDIFG